MEQISIVEVLRPHILLIIALGLMAAIAGYALTFLMHERYTATALVLVRPQQAIEIDSQKSNKQILDLPISQSPSVDTPSKTYIQIIKSIELVGQTVRELGLDQEKAAQNTGETTFVTAYVKPLFEDFKQLLQDTIALLKYGRVIRDDPFTKAVKEVVENLTLKSYEDTYVFEITYTGRDPAVAADVANTTAKSFGNYMSDIRRSETEHILRSLNTQLEGSRQQLETARQRLESYKKEHAVFLYEAEYTAKLKEMSDIELELAKMESATAGNQGTLSTLSSAARRTRLAALLRERRAEIAPLPGIERELKQLELEVKAASAAYEIVDREFKEAEINHSYRVPEVRLVSQAIIPLLPSSPVRIKYAVVALLAGLAAGVGIAFVLEFLNRRVRGIDDIENLVGLKVLGTIPRISRTGLRRAGLV